MADYEERMLVLLVEKYRDSKKDTGENRIVRKTRIKPKDLYKRYNENDADIGKISAVNDAARSCSQKGFVTFRMNGFSNEIAEICLVDEKIEQAEQYLKETYGYQPRYDRKRGVEEMIRRYENKSPTAEAQCEKLRAELKKNRVPKNFLQTEDILKALTFIENNRQTLYLREASMLIYGDSKYLEENCLESVCRLLRENRTCPCAPEEQPDEILREYGIEKEPQKICLKGQITVICKGESIPLGAFADGVEFYAGELRRIDRIIVRTERFMTVENKTSYLRARERDTSFFYLGGYANRFQRDFLKKIYQDNPAVTYLHFGDIDAGGFYIHEHLCRVTGIPFQMDRMSAEQLADRRYQTCLRPLTDSDRKRLTALAAQEAYRETAKYMLRHNVKLEQEIISCRESDTPFQ